MRSYCKIALAALMAFSTSSYADVTHPGSNNIHSGNQWKTNSVGYDVDGLELYAATSQGSVPDADVDIGKQAEAGAQYHVTDNVTWYAEYSNSFDANMRSGIFPHASAGDVARYHGDVPTDGFFTGIKISW